MSEQHDTPTPPSDLDGLSGWIESHQLWLWRYLRFLGAAADLSEDICQESLLAALHHEIPQRDRGVAVTWLRTTARNFYQKQLRSLRQQAALQEMLAMDRLVTTEDLARHAAGSGDQDALRQCLQKVTGDARELLTLRYRNNASRSQIAVALGRSEEGVKTLLRRVKEQLRECIERRRMR